MDVVASALHILNWNDTEKISMDPCAKASWGMIFPTRGAKGGKKRGRERGGGGEKKGSGCIEGREF